MEGTANLLMQPMVHPGACMGGRQGNLRVSKRFLLLPTLSQFSSFGTLEFAQVLGQLPSRTGCFPRENLQALFWSGQNP